MPIPALQYPTYTHSFYNFDQITHSVPKKNTQSKLSAHNSRLVDNWHIINTHYTVHQQMNSPKTHTHNTSPEVHAISQNTITTTKNRNQTQSNHHSKLKPSLNHTNTRIKTTISNQPQSTTSDQIKKLANLYQTRARSLSNRIEIKDRGIKKRKAQY